MIKQWYSGKTKVRATYCGQAVTGTVTGGRGYPRGNKTMLYIDLDTPITVFGQVRNRVILDDDNDVSEIA